MEVSEGIFQVRVPVPFPLKYVNCYLIREDDGWSMVDTGLHDGPAFEAWDTAFHALQIRAVDIRRIILTHAHPDHYGLAGHFQRLSGAPVFALAEEIQVIPIEWEPRGAHMRVLGEFLCDHGVPVQTARRIVDRSLEVLHMLEPQPELTAIHEGELIELGGCRYRAIGTPGHADGHMVLHGEQNGVLFCGDHVLLQITPNIGLWPGLDPDPLRHFLCSLDKVAPLPVKIALPGHRATISDLAGRITELRAHHAARAQACLNAVTGEQTAYEICVTVFPTIQSTDDVRLAVVEVLAHLEYMVGERQLERLEGKPVRYRQIRQGACGLVGLSKIRASDD
jgi:glyoxylase-like metal-dependent hydrolase (beta-lactamase superfamily II)